MPGEEQRDLVLARLEPQPLREAVEVVHHAGVVAVDEHLGLTRLHLEPRGALGVARVVAAVVATPIAAPVVRVAPADTPVRIAEGQAEAAVVRIAVAAVVAESCRSSPVAVAGRSRSSPGTRSLGTRSRGNQSDRGSRSSRGCRSGCRSRGSGTSGSWSVGPGRARAGWPPPGLPAGRAGPAPRGVAVRAPPPPPPRRL